MGLNDQVKGMPSSAPKARMFKDGVKFKYLTGKDPVIFKYLPAFNPANPDASTSILPFVTPTGDLTDWGTLIYQSRFIGHGSGKFGTRQDVLSMRTFAKPGQDIFDPIEKLIQTVSQCSADWGYLIEKQKDKDADRPALSRPTAHFIANIWDANSPAAGVQIGILPPSGTTSLLDARFGLAYQQSANATEEMIRQNHLMAYQVGDLTDPVNGPALTCLKESAAQGDYSKYRVALANDARNQIYRPMIGPNLLAQRYKFNDLRTFMNIPTEEDIINSLVQLFNIRSPKGFHEYVLLKIAFPNHRIPEAPSAPGATATVAAGFGGNPAQNYTQPATAYTPPAVATNYAPPALSTATQPASVYTPPAAQQPTPVNMAAASATNPQPVPAVPATPVVPGDNVGLPGSFDEQEFIKRIRSQVAGSNGPSR